MSLLTSIPAASPLPSRGLSAQTYTAAHLARIAGISPQAVRKQFDRYEVRPVGFRTGQGNAAVPLFNPEKFPEELPLKKQLDDKVREGRCLNVHALLAMPPSHWQPPVPVRDIANDELNKAGLLRDLLLPFLRELGAPSRPAADRDALIAARYADTFGHRITADYARKLFQRAVHRDAGLHNWTDLALYLPEQPRRKAPPTWTLSDSNLADTLPALDSWLGSITSPANPPKAVIKTTWRIAFEEVIRLMKAGTPQKRAAKIVRSLLQARALFLPRNPDALLKSYQRNLDRFLANEAKPGALDDLTAANGQEVAVPEQDIARLRWSASFKHSGRLDPAWREEWEHLTEYTRQRWPRSQRVPRVITRAVNREILDGLVARRQGPRPLDRLLGSILRNVETIPAMHAWVMDDMTANIEVFVRNPDGTTSLCLIQVIAVMDVRSRKFVGWSASLDKGPTAELVCESFVDAVRRTNLVPHHLFLENGWVFGRSHNVVGKRDETGQVIVAGLAEYGCQVHHFTPQKPTAKGELEKAFDLLQRRMERHPGYTGREQRHDAPEQFKREQIEMRRKHDPRDPATCRYDFNQGARAIANIITDYNATEQHGALAGLSPNAAFEKFRDTENPPIFLPPQLHAMLAPGKYRVTVKLSGVLFPHFGTPIQVRGGQLPRYVGRELLAVLDRIRNPDCVTFMALDYSEVFTEPVCNLVDYDESETAPDSGVLSAELEKRGQHRQAINNEYDALLTRFGDRRKELLEQAQAQSGRVPMVDPNFAAATQEGQRQRNTIRAERRARKQVAAPIQRLADQSGIGSISADLANRPGAAESMRSVFGPPTEKETE